MTLPLPRFLNLVYFHLVEFIPADKRKEFDRKLEHRAVDPNEPPSWWGSDAEAAESGLAAARAMGMRVPVMN